MLEDIQTQIVDHAWNEELYPHDHPLIELASNIGQILFDNEKIIPPNTYYCKPFQRCIDDPREDYIPCPECGNPPDYCTNHKHYLCEKCGEPLDFQVDQKGTNNCMWACEYCEHCEYCGSPNLITNEKSHSQKTCEDCGKCTTIENHV